MGSPDFLVSGKVLVLSDFTFIHSSCLWILSVRLVLTPQPTDQCGLPALKILLGGPPRPPGPATRALLPRIVYAELKNY